MTNIYIKLLSLKLDLLISFCSRSHSSDIVFGYTFASSITLIKLTGKAIVAKSSSAIFYYFCIVKKSINFG